MNGGRTLELSAYQRICEGIVLPISDMVLGHDVTSRFRELQEFQWRSAADIDAYRAARLQSLVAFASAKVPFYRDYFRETGIDPATIRSAADLARLPIVGKAPAGVAKTARCEIGIEQCVRRAAPGHCILPEPEPGSP